MQPFTTLTGIAVPLLRDDINTDQITPVQRSLHPDYAALLFARARKLGDGRDDPDFPLNEPQFRRPGILVAGRNFGCGSSRESAVWAMIAIGIRCIVARSFADSYRENCLQNGLLPVELEPTEAELFEARVLAVDGAAPFTVDLLAQRIHGPGGGAIAFEIAPADRMRLLEGLDDIGLTLKHAEDIAQWERRIAGEHPWLQAAMDSRLSPRRPADRESAYGSSLSRGRLGRGAASMSVRKRFRELLAQPGLTLMPGAYDALSARIMEAQGFEALMAGGYAAIGSMLAQPDTGQSNMRDYADHYGRICAAVAVPVYVDADTGFGGVNNARQMVRAFEAAGVAGLFVSDQTFPNRCGYLPGKQVVPAAEMIARIKAMLDARRDADLVICARSDAAAVEGLDAAIARSRLYVEAGADMAKPMGVDTIADIKRVIREVPGPHMATISQAAGARHRDLNELEAAGVAAATFPSLALFAAAQAVRQATGALQRDRSLAGLADQLLPLPDYYELVGLKEQLAREESYDKAAAEMTKSRL
jgi:methylisocitrate lyase